MAASNRLVAAISTAALVVTGIGLAQALPGAGDTDPGIASALATDTLAPIRPMTPQAFGADDPEGLAYPDPTEALSIVDAPAANNTGSMDLTFPIEVPPGHGITPELAATYSSGGGNGWLGVGWDLSVGEVTVDTTFGAPHFDAAKESESYLLDGDLLTPNANGSEWAPRVPGPRADYARQVETEYDEIIRHGTAPTNYFWEVRSADGSVRWYGGTPDSGGPNPDVGASLDPAAVVRNESNQIVTWKLSAQRDVGVNLIRYTYDTVRYVFNASSENWEPTSTCDVESRLCASHTYLASISYTDATAGVTDFNGAPYRIDFIRDSQLSSPPAPRNDPVADAGLGFVDLTLDRLVRVEVLYGSPPPSGRTRTYTQTAARYTFGYAEGRFGKTLLRTITQGVDDPHTHTIDWFDDLGTSATALKGLGEPASQATQDDFANRMFLSQNADISTLGGGESNSGGANLYIGFNPAAPSKTGSFGGGLELGGGDSASLVEWIDLNGDNLPDKVYVEEKGEDKGKIKFRLNTGGPGGRSDWTRSEKVNLPSLSKDSNFSFQISFEAYPVVAIGVGTGLAFSWTDSYFSDVNGDGLVDFVSGGTVHFNRLVGEIPTFSTSSSLTPVPLAAASLPPLPVNDRLAQVTASLEKHSPPIDTVRRWVAPYEGRIEISAPVTLQPSPTNVDGVRVAVQHNDAELEHATLTTAAPTAWAAPTTITRSVEAGDRVYFRVGAIDDGVADIVSWSPVVTYIDSPAWPELDVNGQSQHRFSAAEDFTLAGRPGDLVALPYAGTVRLAGELTTTEQLTDDVSVVAERTLPNGTTTRTVIATVAHDDPTGTRVLAHDFAGVKLHPRVVDLPDDAEEDTATIYESELLSVHLEADSPVDLSDVSWNAALTYAPGATDQDGGPVELEYTDPDTGDVVVLFEHHIRPHVDIYPYTASTDGVRPAELSDGTSTLRFTLKSVAEKPDDVDEVTAIVTVKSGRGLLAKSVQTLDWDEASREATSEDFEVTLDLETDEETWLEVMVRDRHFSHQGIELVSFESVGEDDDGNETTESVDDVIVRWMGQQGIFPLPYRGWGIAGYTAGGDLGSKKMSESAFVVQTENRTAPESPTRSDISIDTDTTDPSYAFLASADPSAPARWIGPREEALWADADGAQTSRLGMDSIAFDGGSAGPPPDGGRKAPRRLGIAGPGLNVSFGVLIFAASASLSPSWGLTDFEDLNGDGYPDVLATGSVTYTDQLGGYRGDPETVTRTDVLNQDLTISVGGGLSTGMVEVVPSSKGNTNAVNGDSATKGQGGSDSGPGFGLGISADGGFSWSSPNASGDLSSDDEWNGQVSTLRSDYGATAEIQRALADVNGDGLPDSVYTTGAGVFAFYNLGYGFTSRAVKLGTGGFESKESANAGAGAGFSLPYGEFSGGVNATWNWDWSTYSWRDLNGDGIVDRLRKDGTSGVKVAFGTGSDLRPEVDYGTFARAEGSAHMAFDRGTGLGAGASATGYIGPLCLVACYLVIGGGGNYTNAVSSTEISIEDVDGDGYADVLQSSDDKTLDVRRNLHGRTNLVKAVTNPLGGRFEVDYDRTGNTTTHPDSVTILSKVEIWDGRTADPTTDDDPRTGRSRLTFEYDGLDYDRAHRASLGFSEVTTHELDVTDDDRPWRTTLQRFHNDNVFEAGLLYEVRLSETAPGETQSVPVLGNSVTWAGRVIRGQGAPGASADSAVKVELASMDQLRGPALHSVASRGWSMAYLPEASQSYWFHEDGTSRIFTATTERDFDGRGNVLVERDLGALADPHDDVTTTVTYADCREAGQSALGCLTDRDQPFYSAGTCTTWVALPVAVQVRGVDPGTGAAALLRERRAPKGMCDNAAPMEIDVLVEPGTFARTNMTFNAYGDYELVMGPLDADGVRYTVRYDYDEDRHTDVAAVTEFDVLAADAADVLANGPDDGNATGGVASSATFDPLSGRVASRTDANGATREFVYDEHGRISTVSMVRPPAPDPSVPPPAAPLLVEYEYHATAPGYAYAIASHTDEQDGNPNPAATDATGGDATATIDTIVFADGLGRIRQVKRDAAMTTGATSVNGRQVDDTVDFDALGRPVRTYGPTVDPGPPGAFSAAARTGAATTLAWTISDAIEETVEPGDRTTTFEYPWDDDDAPLLAWTVRTEPDGREIAVAEDVRGGVRFHRDTAAPKVGQPDLDPLTTAYGINGLGELLSVTDSAGEVSTYAYDLAGQLTSVETPDGGLVTTDYDLAGYPRTMVNPGMRAAGERTTYGYTFGRLTSVDHPGIVDDVQYRYGLDNDDGRFTAGRIADQSDRSRVVANVYDPAGNVVEQASTMKRHTYRPDLPAADLAKMTYTTRWSYDPLGRLATVEYPDAKQIRYVPDGVSVDDLAGAAELDPLLVSEDAPGETVSYGYDSGGLLSSLTGAEVGTEFVVETILPDDLGQPQSIPVPRRTTHEYTYLGERAYDEWLYPVHDSLGNGVETTTGFEPDTRWLSSRETSGPAGALQAISYTYDDAGRPESYVNDLPNANRAINGGRAEQTYEHDGFGRIIGSTGTFTLSANDRREYTYGIGFGDNAPWTVVAKEQEDRQIPLKGKAKVTAPLTYDLERTLGTATGPLQAARDDVTTADGRTTSYGLRYSPNGEVLSVLGAGGNKPSKTNEWDRRYTWTLTGHLTSAERGANLKTWAYDDAGVMRIQDGNLLARDGTVLAERGGGPETLFPNPWVTVQAQKIYKHITDGVDTVATKMDTGGSYETTQLFVHRDLAGSSQIVSDVQGRGFQRHEYFPSGEIWIKDNKETIRTPFQFADGYYEESLDMILFGQRWYDAQRETFLSPDPLLTEVPRALIDQPALGAAYSYAAGSPVANVDPSGLAFFSAHQRVAVKATNAAAVTARIQQLTADGKAAAAATIQKTVDSKKKYQARAESFLEPSALIVVNLNEGTVSFGAPFAKGRKEWSLSKASAPDSVDSSTKAGGGATDGAGGPATDSGSSTQGSTSPSANAGDQGAATQQSGGSTAGQDSTTQDTGATTQQTQTKPKARADE